MNHDDAMRIDFRKWPLGPFALCMLVVATLGSLTLLRMSNALDREIQASEAQLDRVSQLTARKRVVPQTKDRDLSAVGERQWGEQMTLLNRDWSRLLNALVPLDKKTRLLSIDVNPATGVVRVSGVTDSAGRANAYAEALEANAQGVSQVRVLTLKRSGQAVNFEVSASWRE